MNNFKQVLIEIIKYKKKSRKLLSITWSSYLAHSILMILSIVVFLYNIIPKIDGNLTIRIIGMCIGILMITILSFISVYKPYRESRDNEVYEFPFEIKTFLRHLVINTVFTFVTVFLLFFMITNILENIEVEWLDHFPLIIKIIIILSLIVIYFIFKLSQIVVMDRKDI